jgi:hypothetical protein
MAGDHAQRQPEGSGSYRVAELVGNKLLVEKV